MKYLGHCVQTSFNKDSTKCMFALHDNHIIMFQQTTLLMMYQKLVWQNEKNLKHFKLLWNPDSLDWAKKYYQSVYSSPKGLKKKNS